MHKVAGTGKFSESTLAHMIETWKAKQASLERLIAKRIVPHYEASGDFEPPGSLPRLTSPQGVGGKRAGESDVLKREGRMI